jgi:CBS domain-containing protein
MHEFFDYRVQDVMSTPVTVLASTPLSEAHALLDKHGFNALPVVDAQGALVGWLTSLDVLRAFDFPEDAILPSFAAAMRLPVSRVMSRDVYSVCPGTPLTRVIAKLVDTRSRSFPVVDDRRLVGVVSREDVMGALRRGTAGTAG